MRFGKVFLCDRLDGDGGTRILQKQVLPKGGLSLMSLYNNTRWWDWRHRYSWSCCFKQHVHTKRVKKTAGNWRDKTEEGLLNRDRFTFLCLPLNTTAKAPWPIRSLALYSNSPTLSIANFYFVNRLIEDQLMQSNSISADTTSNSPVQLVQELYN